MTENLTKRQDIFYMELMVCNLLLCWHPFWYISAVCFPDPRGSLDYGYWFLNLLLIGKVTPLMKLLASVLSSLKGRASRESHTGFHSTCRLGPLIRHAKYWIWDLLMQRMCFLTIALQPVTTPLNISLPRRAEEERWMCFHSCETTARPGQYILWTEHAR